MPTSVAIELQTVNGDPATSGGNINITTGTVTGAFAVEAGTVSLSTVAAGDSLTISGLSYSYEYLGSHLVRGDPAQPAAYIRIVGPLPGGATLSVGDTFAFDLTGEPGDADYPNLQNGNTQGDVASLNTTDPIQFPGFVCFAKGTLIQTPGGNVAVENLSVGDTVDTLDNGPRKIRLIVHRELNFERDDERHKPIEFKPGSLGSNLPTSTLCVSPQHRILVNVEGQEHLVAAKSFIDCKGIRFKKGCKRVEYYHLIFDRHEMICSHGVTTESFFPGAQAISALDKETRDELLAIFPELANSHEAVGISSARPFIGPSRAKRVMTSGVRFHSIGFETMHSQASNQDRHCDTNTKKSA